MNVQKLEKQFDKKDFRFRKLILKKFTQKMKILVIGALDKATDKFEKLALQCCEISNETTK